MTDEHGFEPLLAFDTDDPQFARGFEAGRLWATLNDLEEPDCNVSFNDSGEVATMSIETWLRRGGWEEVAGPPPRWEPPDAYAIGVCGPSVATWRAVVGRLCPPAQPRSWRRLRRAEKRRAQP